MFNIRKEKVKILDEYTTLDTAHRKVAKKFKTKKKKLPTLKKELKSIEIKLEKINNNDSPLLAAEQQIRCDLIQKQHKLIDDIFDIENNIDEVNYYDLVNEPLCNYLKEYRNNKNKDIEIDYDPNIHNDMKSSDTSSFDDTKYNPAVYKKKKTPQKRRRNENVNNKSIMDYFNLQPKKNEENIISKKKFYDEYRFLIDPSYKLQKKSIDEVLECECGGEKILMGHEGVLICSTCGETDMIFVETDKGTHKDPIPDKPGYPYKRINHFNEFQTV